MGIIRHSIKNRNVSCIFEMPQIIISFVINCNIYFIFLFFYFFSIIYSFIYNKLFMSKIILRLNKSPCIMMSSFCPSIIIRKSNGIKNFNIQTVQFTGRNIRCHRKGYIKSCMVIGRTIIMDLSSFFIIYFFILAKIDSAIWFKIIWNFL